MLLLSAADSVSTFINNKVWGKEKFLKRSSFRNLIISIHQQSILKLFKNPADVLTPSAVYSTVKINLENRQLFHMNYFLLSDYRS